MAASIFGISPPHASQALNDFESNLNFANSQVSYMAQDPPNQGPFEFHKQTRISQNGQHLCELRNSDLAFDESENVNP